MSKHIAIVSVSHEGAALCYRSIRAEASAVMGCIEPPLIPGQEDVEDVRMPLLDSTRLLAKAAPEEAL